MIKRLTYILILFITCANITSAQPHNANLQYNDTQYSFKHFNIKNVLYTANKDMLLFKKSKSGTDKQKYLDDAMKNYFIATKIDDTSIDGYLGLALIYDIMRQDKLAKEFFFKSINIDGNSPKANFYFGDFYFNRSDYLTALNYYKIAYKNGYSKKYELNYKLGIIYEKLADIETAKSFYWIALKLMPKNSELYDKIRLLDDLNYCDSQYYLFKKKYENY